MRLKTSPRRARRAGFTLIEMLVVISIIVVIIGVGIGATMRFRDAATNAAGDNQLKQMQIALNDQYQAVVNDCHKNKTPEAVLVYSGGNKDRAQAIHTAAMLRAHFPETFAEATTSFSIGTQAYNNPPRGAFKQVAGSSGLSLDEQAAVLLYLVLSEQAVGLGNSEVRSAESNVKDSAGKEFKVFVDPRGTPVRYYRWAQSAQLDATPYGHASPAGSLDPLDPRKLVAGTPYASTPTTGLNAAPLNLRFTNNNRVPSVVSFGKNKVNDNFAPEADDSVGYRLNRQGNQGK